MGVGKVDVREKREGGAVGAKGRAGGKARDRTRALGWVVRRWLAGRRRWRRGGGVYASSGIWLAAGRFFVSQVVLSCTCTCTLGETAGRAVHVAERVRPARSASRLSLNCRSVWTRPAFQLCCTPISILPTCSGIGKTLPRVRRQQTGSRWSSKSSMPYTLLPSTVHT